MGLVLDGVGGAVVTPCGSVSRGVRGSHRPSGGEIGFRMSVSFFFYSAAVFTELLSLEGFSSETGTGVLSDRSSERTLRTLRGLS